MPRNAAKRLNNEEPCLPTPTKFNKVRRNSSNKIQFIADEEEEEQQQKHKQEEEENLDIILGVFKGKTTKTSTTTTIRSDKSNTTKNNIALEQDGLFIKLIETNEKNQIFNNNETLKRRQIVAPRVIQQVEKEVLDLEAEVVRTLAEQEAKDIHAKNSKATKTPKQRGGRRRNWRKNRLQNNDKNTPTAGGLKTTTNLSRNCYFCCSAGGGGDGDGDRGCYESQTAVVLKNNQRGNKECVVCSCENVFKTFENQKSNNNNNNKNNSNSGSSNSSKTSAASNIAGLTNSLKKKNTNDNNDYCKHDNVNDDDDDDDDDNDATITIITTADIPILPKNYCQDNINASTSKTNTTTTAGTTTTTTTSSSSEPQDNNKNFRLLTLRHRKKEEDDIKQHLTTDSTSSITGANKQPHLDPNVFNRIEVFIEIEDIKANANHNYQNKRKRFDNFPTITTRGRRAATQKYYTESAAAAAATAAAAAALLAISNSTVTQAVQTLPVATAASSTQTITTSAAKIALITTTTTTSATKSTNITSNSNTFGITTLGATKTTSSVAVASTSKRRRIMSLYDRRYQTASTSGGRSNQEADITGRSALIANGYLSTTRGTIVGLTGAGALTDVNDLAMEATAPPYYLTSAAAAAAASSASSSNNTALMVATNGPTLNHAPSMATLCNIGNTCYLNSVLYTLRFAPQFLHNLHHLVVDLPSVQQHLLRQRAKSASLGRGSSSSATHSSGTLAENTRSWSSKDLLALDHDGAANNKATGNKNAGCAASMLTKKTQHQLLTEKLHEVYQCLHRNEVVESTEPHHADTLLQAIQDAYVTFAGNQQQDAHEFLMCVFNSLRETSQMLIKAIAECPEVIANGFIANPDELDGLGFGGERGASDTSSTSGIGQGLLAGSAGTLTSTATSSLSNNISHNITKASFFSRKSKRKDDTKKSKITRLQSPLKDSAVPQSQQQQNTSSHSSLFYLNATDLNNGSDGALAATAAGLNGSDEECKIQTPLFHQSPAPVFKSKEALAAKIRELGLDFFREDFEGITVATTKCLSCETITEQRESMIDISVPVPLSGYDAADYAEKPSAFIQNSCVTREYFRGENKYRCEKCIGYTEAIRSVSYEVLPRLLVIQLSRFSGGMEKISSYVPTTFTLSCFCSKCCELGEGNKLHVYKLYSVITHVGATMTVGHYIAYTCSLDWANEYMNCPKERQRAAAISANANLLQKQQQQQQQHQQQQQQQQSNGSLSSTTTAAASAASAAASAIASSGTSLMKKMKFGRSKASSSGDITKQLTKNLNGLTTTTSATMATNKAQYTLTNGISKLSMHSTSAPAAAAAAATSASTTTTTASQSSSTQTASIPTPVTCYSLNCCATRICSVHQMQQQLNEENFQNGHAPATGYNSYPSGYGSTGRGSSAKSSYHMAANLSAASGSSTEPIWYMCDDDKIKAMPQREFEDILSPSRKVTITPYLLFYARFDLQPSISASTDRITTCNKTASISSSTASSCASGSTLVSKI